MSVRAKLLAAGGATCAYPIPAEAVAFPECPVMENWKVSHSEGGRGCVEERAFLWALMWRQNCEVGFQMVPNPLFLPLHGIIGLRGSLRDLWAKPLAFRWAKNSPYQAWLWWTSGTHSVICSGGRVEEFWDSLYCYKISLLPTVSVLFCLVVCARGEKFPSSVP